MTYTAKQVHERLGITRRQIRHWITLGIFEPSARTEGGHARFTDADLRRLRLINVLLGARVERRVVHEVLALRAEEIEAVHAELQAALRPPATGTQRST